jgi:flavin reductase (DIM6/NTAB) family NADH-FMN oxidoreductase RutF
LKDKYKIESNYPGGLAIKENQKVIVPFERSLYLLHPYNSVLITSLDENENPNIMTAAWIIPTSVEPPLIVMSIRPERYSFRLIKNSKEFIVNIPTYNLVKEVLFCGRRSGKNVRKFNDLDLTPMKAKKVKPPIIKECIGHIECTVKEIITTGDHELIIGDVIAAYAIEGYFEDYYDIRKFHPCLHLGKNTFTTCLNESFEPKLQ